MNFSKLFDAAKKVWEHGGKEAAEKLIDMALNKNKSNNQSDLQPNHTDGQSAVSNRQLELSDSIGASKEELYLSNISEEKQSVMEVKCETDSNKLSVGENIEIIHEAEVIEEIDTENGIKKVHTNMTNAEEDEFIASLQNGIGGIRATNPAEAMAALKTMGTAVQETVKFVELQEVKRDEIRAEKEVRIAQIEATKQVLQDYLSKTFDERKDAFNKYFDVVDVALKKGDNIALSNALESINSLASSSPFKNLADMNAFKEIMNNNNEELDI